MHHLHSSVDSGGVYRKSTISVRMASNFPAELPQSTNLSCAGPLLQLQPLSVALEVHTYTWPEVELNQRRMFVKEWSSPRLRFGYSNAKLGIKHNTCLFSKTKSWWLVLSGGKMSRRLEHRNELVNRGPPMNCNKVLQFFHEWTHSCKWIIIIVNIFTGVIKTHSSVHLCSAYTQPAFCLL